MISLLEIATNINEADVDDDEIIKYKDKEGESQEMTAGAAKKQPDDHPAKVAYNKMSDDGGDDSEKDSGGKLGGGDFDRDGGDEPDMDSDDGDGGTPQVPKDGQAALGVVDKINDFEREGEAGLYDLQDEYDLSDDDVYELKNIGFDFSNAGEPLEDNQIAKMQDKINNLSPNAKKALESEFMDKPKVDEPKGDDVEISDANSGPIDREDIKDMLMKDSDIVDKMGDDVYFDGMDLVSSKFDDDTIASIPDDANMTLADLKKQIMDYEEEQDESIKVIDGKKYKAIKESKKNPRILKEIYDRTFRSLK